MDSKKPSAKAREKRLISMRIKQAADIKRRLYEKGYLFTDIERIHSLPRGTVSDTLRAPNLKGEEAIAKALETSPQLLWRDRYHASGLRKSPQDHSRPPTMAQRRKLAEART